MSQYLTLFRSLLLLISTLSALSSCRRYNDEANIRACTTRTKFHPCKEGSRLIAERIKAGENSKAQADGRTSFFSDELLRVIPIYRLRCEGFTPGDHYRLYQSGKNSEVVFLGNYVIDSSGQAISDSPGGFPLSDQTFGCFSDINGSQLIWTLVSDNPAKSRSAFGSPHPIEYRWDDGAYAEIWVNGADANEFFFQGEGFQPEEVLQFELVDGKSGYFGDTVTDPDGTILIPVPSDLFYLSGGALEAMVRREKNPEVGRFYFFWGSYAQSPASFQR